MATGCLGSALSLFLRLHSKYLFICEDENEKATTVYFGVYSIITTIITCVLFTLGIWGLALLLNSLDKESLGVLVVVPLIIILALVELVLFAQYVFGGLLGVIYQLKCNRRPIGWVALGLFLAATVGMIVGIILIASISFQA